MELFAIPFQLKFKVVFWLNVSHFEARHSTLVTCKIQKPSFVQVMVNTPAFDCKRPPFPPSPPSPPHIHDPSALQTWEFEPEPDNFPSKWRKEGRSKSWIVCKWMTGPFPGP